MTLVLQLSRCCPVLLWWVLCSVQLRRQGPSHNKRSQLCHFYTKSPSSVTFLHRLWRLQLCHFHTKSSSSVTFLQRLWRLQLCHFHTKSHPILWQALYSAFADKSLSYVDSDDYSCATFTQSRVTQFCDRVCIPLSQISLSYTDSCATLTKSSNSSVTRSLLRRRRQSLSYNDHFSCYF